MSDQILYLVMAFMCGMLIPGIVTVFAIAESSKQKKLAELWEREAADWEKVAECVKGFLLIKNPSFLDQSFTKYRLVKLGSSNDAEEFSLLNLVNYCWETYSYEELEKAFPGTPVVQTETAFLQLCAILGDREAAEDLFSKTEAE